MRVRWTFPAAQDLEGIKNYLQAHLPHYAEPTVRTIYERILSLKTKPNRGRPGQRTGTRELPLTPLPYVVVYAVKQEAVEILHIYRGAQGLAIAATLDSDAILIADDESTAQLPSGPRPY